MRTGVLMRVIVAAAVGLGGCGGRGGSTPLGVTEGALSPEQAAETFLAAAQEAGRHRSAGAFTEADRAYERMAAVFGTESGSIHRSMSAEDVRSRMIVLSACLRPGTYRIIVQSDAISRQRGKAGVTVEVDRGSDTLVLPFSVVRGREDRWFIDRIDISNVTC